MSRLSDMIKELCPDGVEYRWFEDCCEYVRGITYNKSNEARSDSEPVWRVLRANNITLSSNTLNFDDVKLIEKTVRVKGDQFLTKGDILICAGSGSKEHIGKVAYIDEDMEYTFGGFMAVIRCNSSIDSRYLFHIFTSKLFLLYLDTALNSSTINNLNFTVMKKFIFPVPPLPIQNEIVKLLDNFTELTAELTAELALRKKQYNFYRDSLLNFDQKNSKVEWKTLGDVCDILSGYPFDSSQFVNNGIRLMRGMNVKRGVLDFQEGNNRYWKNTDGLDKYKLEADDIIIAMDGSLVGQSYGLVKEEHLPLLLVQRVARVRSKESNSHYVYHYISSGKLTEYVNAKRTAGAVPHISLKDIEKFEIPFPDIEKQNKIAEILDRFDTLCNDLTQGLPAEIAARKKQYEYYRDKLLTFRRK